MSDDLLNKRVNRTKLQKPRFLIVRPAQNRQILPPLPIQKNRFLALSNPIDNYTAPEVVASGRGLIAEQILKLAFEHGVKVHEDADLAEILTALEIGEEIPVEAFIAVAEILRYVYASDGVNPPEILSHADKR